MVHPGRGRNFQRKISIGKQAAFFHFFIQGPVYTNAFFNGNATVCIDKHFYIIGGFYSYFHQKHIWMRADDIAQHILYCAD